MTKITIARSVVEPALDALELYVPKEDYENKPVGNVMDDLRAALAEPEEPAIPWGKAIGAEQKRGCRLCGIGAAPNTAMGYVCPRMDCPTRVTCGVAA